jgi:transposase-like protein
MSLLYLYQTFFLKWLENTYLTAFTIILLIYSLYYFQFFKNKSCPECGAKFSLSKKGTYKIDECKIKGIPYDINESEFECTKCGKLFTEAFREPHEEYDSKD